MRNTNAASTAGQFQPEFNVVLAYDEHAGGIRAKEFFDTLVLDQGELFQFICHLWKFEGLREPRLFDVAARDAARADMIVLAIRQSQELPVEVRRWIDSGLSDEPSRLSISNEQNGKVGIHLNGGQELHQLQSLSTLNGEWLNVGGATFDPPWFIEPAEPLGFFRVAQPPVGDRQISRNVRQMLDSGRRIFRYDTFGNESFWAGSQRLHEAIAGTNHGGVGGGVSPAVALAVGLKVDVEALPKSVQHKLGRGEIDLNDPATTLALLQLDSVVGVKGFFEV